MKLATLHSLRSRALALLLVLLATPSVALADELNSGDTAWMLISTGLVLFMTLPGLALFYGGLIRTRNVLSMLMQCMTLAALITPLWVIIGYSLAFDTTGMQEGTLNVNSFIGGFGKAFFGGVTAATMSGSIPEVLFACFQLTFAIITPCLITGAYIERIKFSSMVLFSLLWVLFVYIPICHMTWAGEGGVLWDLGVLDFAGGGVVHLTAGVAALVACLVIGPRQGFRSGKLPAAPHSMTLCFVGTAMLWVGWFGFNGGSAVAADGTAAMAIFVTQICAATSGATWMFIEWVRFGRPTLMGIATGAVGGLVAITPGSGFVGPMGALCIGVASGAACYLAVAWMKPRLGYDDSLDVFGVHGVAGLLGSLLTGVFAHTMFGGSGIAHESIIQQLAAQLEGSLLIIVWTVVVTWALLKIVDLIIGLRVDEEDEFIGLDISVHGEAAYDY